MKMLTEFLFYAVMALVVAMSSASPAAVPAPSAPDTGGCYGYTLTWIDAGGAGVSGVCVSSLQVTHDYVVVRTFGPGALAVPRPNVTCDRWIFRWVPYDGEGVDNLCVTNLIIHEHTILVKTYDPNDPTIFYDGFDL